MSIDNFEYSPVTVKTIYDTTAKGVLFNRQLLDGQITQLYIFEDEKWLEIDLNQVSNINVRTIDESETVYINSDYINKLEIEADENDVIREIIANHTYS